jgi:hypothetical protein
VSRCVMFTISRGPVGAPTSDVSQPGDDPPERSSLAGLMQPPVGGHEPASISSGQREVQAVVDGDAVTDGQIDRRPATAVGGVELDRCP